MPLHTDPQPVPQRCCERQLGSYVAFTPTCIQRQMLSVGLDMKFRDFIAGGVGVGLPANRLQDFGEVSQRSGEVGAVALGAGRGQLPVDGDGFLDNR